MSLSMSADVAEALVSPVAEPDTEVAAQFVVAAVLVAEAAAAEVIAASTAQFLL